MEKLKSTFACAVKKLTKADMKKVMGGAPSVTYLIPFGAPHCRLCECPDIIYQTRTSFYCRETNGLGPDENPCDFQEGCVGSVGFLTCAECDSLR